MSTNVKQLISSLKQGEKFSQEIDKSTNISDDAQLLLYVHYRGKKKLKENFLFCKVLETTTRGQDIFALADTFMKA